jgi:hypothetical protein
LFNSFNILDVSTWDQASDSVFVWKDNTFYDTSSNDDISEKMIVRQLSALFYVLSLTTLGDKYEHYDKKRLIECILGEFCKGRSLNEIRSELVTMINNEDKLSSLTGKIEIKQEEKRKEQIPDGLFSPRDPDTYQFAKNKPLVIDGVSIFKTYEDVNGKEIKENETEKSFVSNLSSLLEIQKKVIVWEEAVKLVKPDFTFEGKEPSQETPGYIERVNEVYQSILKNPAVRLTKKQEQEYINNHIAIELDLCSPMPPIVKSLGGYGFTQAQLEVLGSLPDEDLAAIGKTMSSGLRGGKLEQALFNAHGSLNRDWHYLAELHGKNAAQEKKIMSEYFSCYEFDTEDQVYKVLNSSEYLNTHPKLQKEAIKNALESLEGLK